MLRTSEWVSIGHPDKVADAISCYILDRFLENDPDVRFAVEVQIKDNFVTLGGEVTSKMPFDEKLLAIWTKRAVDEIGYTKAYQNRWGKENTICGDDLIVVSHISAQSPDIAQGVNAGGWGDQGIFWGMAENNPSKDYMPLDLAIAREIGKNLLSAHYGGIDIKTQVTLNDDEIEEVVVAIPLLEKNSINDVESVVNFTCGRRKPKAIHVNGTGRYVKHGPIGDCGTTGRKLAVDFYGGNCRIGGGSPWTKDSSKADLTLNVLARFQALDYMKFSVLDPFQIHCSISCRIGSPEIRVSYWGDTMRPLLDVTMNADPLETANRFGLREPHFFDKCKNGLFS